MPPSADSRAGRIAFTHPDFVLFEIARFLIVSAVEMQAVAVGWQVYDITKRALDLGLVGLAQFLPGILLFLVSGHASDRFDRRKVLGTCYAGYAVCSGLLLVLAVRGTHAVLPIYLVLILLGVVRSFNGTASRSILPQLVPEEHFSNAVAWNATTFQAATIIGPSVRRRPVRRVSRTISSLCSCDDYCHGRTGFGLPHQNAATSAPSRAHDVKNGFCRVALYLA